MEEILRSQTAMLSRLGKSSANDEKVGDISKAYRQQEAHAKTWCARLGIHAISVSYEGLVHCTDEVLPQIADFLGSPADKLPAMRARIDPAMHRSWNKSNIVG